MTQTLTKRQRSILDFISESIRGRGFPPTLREIGDNFGIRSTNGVNDHLKALEKKGYLHREDGRSRALRPIDPVSGAPSVQADNVIPFPRRQEQSWVDVPVVGRVAAGQPLLAEEHVEDTVRIDRMLIGTGRDVFGLRVFGESMIEDGIFEGDYVFVRKTPTASPGEIVVAMVDGEATLKRFYPEGDHIRLQPANASMSPILIRRADFRSVDILGVVVGIYRKI